MEKAEIKLPDEISVATIGNPRDLVVISIPKMGKGTILGDFTKKYNALVFDLEKGGYEYISARKMSIFPEEDTTLEEGYKNYIKMRNVLLDQKGKYDYLLIDGLSDLDVLSEIGGTYAFMNSVMGNTTNRERETGKKIEVGQKGWRYVTEILDKGGGYNWTRKWFKEQVDIFRQIAPYRIYAAHVTDKFVKDGQKEEVVGSEIFLTGKLKSIFASKVTALAKLVAEGEKRYLNFEVANDSIIAGSRNPRLKGKILISEMQEDGNVKTFWENIYK